MTYEIDATNESLGRLASKIVSVLRGKNLPNYKPEALPKTKVLVKNLNKVKFTGSKLKDKKYHHFSGYPSGIRTRTLLELWQSRPKYVLRQTIYKMLPKNRTRDKIIKNLQFE